MTSHSSLQAYATFASGAAASSSSLVTPSLSLLADPPIRLADAAAMDYLLIEMVRTLRASAAVEAERASRIEREMAEAGLLPRGTGASAGVGGNTIVSGSVSATGTSVGTPAKQAAAKLVQRDSASSVSSVVLRSGATNVVGAEDDEDEEVRTRLEAVGVHVGSNIAERLCRDRPRFVDTLDSVKFVCKEVWSTCWDKQVDNLRTNHRGVYVLQDNHFKPILRISSHEGPAVAIRRAKTYVAMPAGIIKGALARMGYQAVVVAEITQLPQCTFQVRLLRGT